MALPERLAESRIKRRIGPTEAGRAAGVTKQTIYNWERGIGEPNLTQAVALASLYEVDLAWLIGYPLVEPVRPEFGRVGSDQ